MISSIGDDGQLQPFEILARKINLTPSIFDLPISRPMKHFTIHGQYRCNDTYQGFLGKLLLMLPYYIFLFKYNHSKSVCR